MTENDLKFLKGLAKNNNREWFNKHKADFETAQAHFLELVGGLIFALSEFDESLTTIDPKSCMFRIYRDVRFAKDKSPYKNHLGAFICAGGRKSNTVPGYYIHIEPGGKSIFGAGYYLPDKNVLDRLRAEIASDKSRIAAMFADKKLRKVFPDIEDEHAAKKVPRGFPADHKNAELLKHKSYFLLAYLSDAEVTGKSLLKGLAKRGELLARSNTLLLQIARGK